MIHKFTTLSAATVICLGFALCESPAYAFDRPPLSKRDAAHVTRALLEVAEQYGQTISFLTSANDQLTVHPSAPKTPPRVRSNVGNRGVLQEFPLPWPNGNGEHKATAQAAQQATLLTPEGQYALIQQLSRKIANTYGGRARMRLGGAGEAWVGPSGNFEMTGMRPREFQTVRPDSFDVSRLSKLCGPSHVENLVAEFMTQKKGRVFPGVSFTNNKHRIVVVGHHGATRHDPATAVEVQIPNPLGRGKWVTRHPLRKSKGHYAIKQGGANGKRAASWSR